jgi:hypothetical protein
LPKLSIPWSFVTTKAADSLVLYNNQARKQGVVLATASNGQAFNNIYGDVRMFVNAHQSFP